MPKFSMCAMVTVSAYTTVEAETHEDALRIAQNREVALGGERNGNDPDEQWIIKDADGAPQEIRFEE